MTHEGGLVGAALFCGGDHGGLVPCAVMCAVLRRYNHRHSRHVDVVVCARVEASRVSYRCLPVRMCCWFSTAPSLSCGPYSRTDNLQTDAPQPDMNEKLKRRE